MGRNEGCTRQSSGFECPWDGRNGDLLFMECLVMATDDKKQKNEDRKDNEIKDEQLEDVAGGITRENYSGGGEGYNVTRDNITPE